MIKAQKSPFASHGLSLVQINTMSPPDIKQFLNYIWGKFVCSNPEGVLISVVLTRGLRSIPEPKEKGPLMVGLAICKAANWQIVIDCVEALGLILEKDNDSKLLVAEASGEVFTMLLKGIMEALHEKDSRVLISVPRWDESMHAEELRRLMKAERVKVEAENTIARERNRCEQNRKEFEILLKQIYKKIDDNKKKMKTLAEEVERMKKLQNIMETHGSDDGIRKNLLNWDTQINGGGCDCDFVPSSR